jgi:hypothetical protein
MVISPLFLFVEMPVWAFATEFSDGDQKFKYWNAARSRALAISRVRGNAKRFAVSVTALVERKARAGPGEQVLAIFDENRVADDWSHGIFTSIRPQASQGSRNFACFSGIETDT